MDSPGSGGGRGLERAAPEPASFLAEEARQEEASVVRGRLEGGAKRRLILPWWERAAMLGDAPPSQREEPPLPASSDPLRERWAPTARQIHRDF